MTPRRRILVSFAVLTAAALTFGLAWFQPWKLFVDERVDEALPAVATQSAPAAGPTVAPRSTAAPRTSAPPSVAAAEPVDALVSRGTLISHEHDTSGTVSVVRRADGSRVLAIADLATSNGPDVHVWLTDQPVLAGEDGWHVFDDGAYVSLGTLKGNLGNQVYSIPADVDLGRLTSVSLWCDRFDVSFGAAELHAVQ